MIRVFSWLVLLGRSQAFKDAEIILLRHEVKYHANDLVCLVRPRQSAPFVQAGKFTWEEAAREAWAMDPGKADRVRVLIAVHEDVVVGAWAVRGAEHQVVIPEGKTRKVSRSVFKTAADPRLGFLIGAPSPKPPRRNPQTTFELRDLPSSGALIGSGEPPAHGMVRLGPITLTVSEDGRAQLQMPAGTSLTIQTVN